VYLEAGHSYFVARTRAPQARKKKWFHCEASFEDKFACKQKTSGTLFV
jgi:hypothetical protein